MDAPNAIMGIAVIARYPIRVDLQSVLDGGAHNVNRGNLLTEIGEKGRKIGSLTRGFATKEEEVRKTTG
jgi:hypothetical protein